MAIWNTLYRIAQVHFHLRLSIINDISAPKKAENYIHFWIYEQCDKIHRWIHRWAAVGEEIDNKDVKLVASSADFPFQSKVLDIVLRITSNDVDLSNQSCTTNGHGDGNDG